LPFWGAEVIRYRLTISGILLLFIALPLAFPLGQLLADPSAWRGWDQVGRLLLLGQNTLGLVAGTLVLCLPFGLGAAVLLYRTDLPGRRWLRLLLLLTLFIPLPLFASGWQTVLGSGGWLPVSFWNATASAAADSLPDVWVPWGQGMRTAIWIHAVAGLPWVVLLVGQGLRWVERELEEDALTATTPMSVLLRVSLPRASASIAAAGMWVAVQTATEITVTDVMQVRTFAEEVYTQFVAPEAGRTRGDAVARAVAVALPGVVLTALVVLAMARRWEANLPGRAGLTAPLLFRLGRWRWFAAALVLLVTGLLLGVPVAGLVWRAGLSGAPPAWSPGVVWQHLRLLTRAESQLLPTSLLLAALAGLLCGVLALLTCWAAREARWFRVGVLILMAVVWATPGPVIGLGLKAAMARLLDLTGSRVLERWLWHGPSPVPLLWIDLIRFFPFAVAVLWPVVRLLPRELLDAARVDGATPTQELVHVVVPLTASTWLRAALVGAVLSLGELSAGKLVSTPGLPSYAEVVFTQMHYGVTNDLAARCLLLLLAVAAGGLLVALLGDRADE
jgi:iron(III) transport system permease protein